jgi:hypothetical protein
VAGLQFPLTPQPPILQRFSPAAHCFFYSEALFFLKGELTDEPLNWAFACNFLHQERVYSIHGMGR